jgi:hypothetical protein
MKAGDIKRNPDGTVAIDPEPGKPVRIDAAANLMMFQRMMKKRRGDAFFPNRPARRHGEHRS